MAENEVMALSHDLAERTGDRPGRAKEHQIDRSNLSTTPSDPRIRIWYRIIYVQNPHVWSAARTVGRRQVVAADA